MVEKTMMREKDLDEYETTSSFEYAGIISGAIIYVETVVILVKSVVWFSFRLYMALAQATTVRSGNQILSCKSHKSCPEGFACCNTPGGNEWVFCTQDQVTYFKEKRSIFLGDSWD